MIVTLSDPNEAAPIPCKNRSVSRRLKSRAKKHALPAIPKSSSDGTRIFFLPNRSASTPKTGVKRTPGSVNTTMSRPTAGFEIPNASCITGKAGEILDTPITTINVTTKTI